MQQQVAAHEAAHVVLGHNNPDISTWVKAAALVSGALLAIAALDILLQSPLLWFIPSLLILLTMAPAAMAVIKRSQRRQEAAADAHACTWGYHYTDELEQWTRKNEPKIATAWWYLPLRDHPLPRDRRESCQRRAHST